MSRRFVILLLTAILLAGCSGGSARDVVTAGNVELT
jgi:PBP1b-binding outer membrane lipoprotein LpoB